MGTGSGVCEHRCRNTCAMLSDALQDEDQQITKYQSMLAQCDDPVMIKFVHELISTHTGLISRIHERLSEIKANAEVLDDIIEGFES